MTILKIFHEVETDNGVEKKYTCILVAEYFDNGVKARKRATEFARKYRNAAIDHNNNGMYWCYMRYSIPKGRSGIVYEKYTSAHCTFYLCNSKGKYSWER